MDEANLLFSILINNFFCHFFVRRDKSIDFSAEATIFFLLYLQKCTESPKEKI